MLDFLKQPWPWYVAGPLIGLMVPALLIIGNKSFGISSSLRHVCAACVPAKIPSFNTTGKRNMESIFVAGIVGGGFLAVSLLGNPDPIQINPKLQAELASYGVTNYDSFVPSRPF